MKCDIGVVGLGVMGGNLALNIERHGFHVAVFDIDASKAKDLVNGAGKGKNLTMAATQIELLTLLRKPRRVLLMIPAGKPVEAAIKNLGKHLEQKDILIDGGNSHFLDTERRCREMASMKIHFAGTGISGGARGALLGPSIMPGGDPETWDELAPILRAIAAKAEDGEPCVDYMGPGGAGHYVKMVHNGIEYANMQLIAETYDILLRGLDLQADQLHDIFAEWDRGELKSYLIEITATVLARRDPETGRAMPDVILDEAEQKGTGKWTSQNAFELRAPIPTINEAVESRMLSAYKAQRVRASRLLHGPSQKYGGDHKGLIDAARQSLFASEIVAYAQGIHLLSLASKEYAYGFRPGVIAKIWRAGCIIRASMLEDIMAAFKRDEALESLLLDDVFRAAIEERQEAWRFVVQTAIGMGIPVPALSASLAYFDSYRSARLPANLTQAQRDYFGAHTYRRIDRPGTFHTEWS
jgi:6-phosphogluconate dehydrogenase